ncbi:hypothetical protein HMPREF9517_02903 [Enterococcus faecalis TX1341]|jgi:hypothetical protein|uniref:Uncharacterized protein n=1 Tax=Enterococcus faecalis TX4248 TaxID=749495 RepID=A0A125W2L5_ENTFL|nr:hypothetical protein EF62_2695 [Enterococcus faecalis 62]EEI57807.1 hypothetical protein HMPREF0346_1174 [Enterococcus faecalis EnGen0297]EEN75758.1 hypothetical protein HMPREF0349_0323 [Enterococcus faecalis TX1322]EFM67923.1 hypothetical protein HMPREF9509_00774 [Enterococcus faecalis TX0411]EFM70687.1 hypothetical protein HMPREF9505_01095 [Enterococcus faecalis TX0109]EFM75702.1 hypothetical protein HMPREF9521_02379 [Enterococcus faecalis TX2134]EFM81517.1 hypothetical protein HMPREF949
MFIPPNKKLIVKASIPHNECREIQRKPDEMEKIDQTLLRN